MKHLYAILILDIALLCWAFGGPPPPPTTITNSPPPFPVHLMAVPAGTNGAVNLIEWEWELAIESADDAGFTNGITTLPVRYRIKFDGITEFFRIKATKVKK